ncbi:hypothetical protein VTK73DRAFT_9361 [Phialemonium thermophilum]|uniref:Ubiquitin carboxyl-terminal hydrolase n=1 Tax=Phialemonium thermophilum TaxID=223376 RepID=A0ABR3W2T2_9PEZI
MPVEGVHIDGSGRKVFIPLENNPDVFASLVRDLGASDELGFYDVLSLDEAELLALVPRPVHALIFITPPDIYHIVRERERTPRAGETLAYDKSGPDEPVVWFRQTIGHACGLYALIHALANGGARPFLKKGSLLDRLIEEATPLAPVPRARVLYDSAELEAKHMRAARTGDSRTPGAHEPVGLHFITFTKGRDGHLYELDGDTDGPLDLGPLADEGDMLSEAALRKGVRRFLDAAGGELQFSIVALARSQ